MNINIITTDDLRGMKSKDGLILQGCGGDLKEWVDGINNMINGLMDDKIFWKMNATKIKKQSVVERLKTEHTEHKQTAPSSPHKELS